MPSWFKRDDPDDNQGEIKPEQIREQVSAEFETKFAEYKREQEERTAPLLAMAASFRAKQDEDQQIANRQRQQQQHSADEVDEDLWITNPQEASARTMRPLLQQTAGIAAITMRKEILGEREYYTGELKEKIDALIEQQPLASRANYAVLDHAYFSVVGRHSEEIAEGKYKKRMFGSGFNDGGTGGKTGNGKDAPRKYNSEEKLVMEKFGMTEKEFEKAEQEMNYV